MKNLITLILFTATISLSATTIRVKQDGTGDWTTIQSAVNASADGDTVLVWPGTYYENVNFNGHRITVASLELTTGDETYIDSTIVNGNQTGSCFCIKQDEYQTTIQGFTITNGSGTLRVSTYCGGGIHVFTNPSYNYNNNLSVINCCIRDNLTFAGGGIEIYNSDVVLRGVSVYRNFSNVGGGINAGSDADIEFDEENRCSVYNNYAGTGPDIRLTNLDQDIYCYLDTFTVNPPNHYFAAVHNNLTHDGELIFDVYNGWMEEVNHDLYVAPDGDNNNSGLSPEEPMQNISWALHKIASDSLNPKTVHIAPGTYSKDLTGLILPLCVKTFSNVIGDSLSPPVMINNDNMLFLYMVKDARNCEIQNLKMSNTCPAGAAISSSGGENLYFHNIEIENVYGDGTSIANFYMMQNLELSNLYIHDNEAERNAGIEIGECENVYMHDCRLDNNHSVGSGEYQIAYSHLFIWMKGDVVIENCFFGNGSCASNHFSPTIRVTSWEDLEPHLTFQNNLIYNNTVPTDEVVRLECRGGADIYNCTFVNNEADEAALEVEGYEVNIANCIFDDNTLYEIAFPYLEADVVPTVLNIDHSNIRGGESSVYIPDGHPYTLSWHEGNIDAPPDWVEYNPDILFPYRLPGGDLSIDAGRADTTGMYLPIYDIMGSNRVIDGDNDGIVRIDMGCYEYDPEMSNNQDIPPYETALTNYPNPFNPSTTIRFTIANTAKVNISIYNMRGQKIRDLGGITYQAGVHKIVWDGRNNRQSTVSSGVYICRMNYSGKTLYRKMIMMK